MGPYVSERQWGTVREDYSADGGAWDYLPHNAGPDAETLHVLPRAWFRNPWSWDAGTAKPVIEAAGPASMTIEHPFLGTMELLAAGGPAGAPTPLFCENETNIGRLYGAAPVTSYPKGRSRPTPRTASTIT